MFFAFYLLVMVSSCKKESSDNTVTPEQAKVEMRAAAQQLTTEMNAMMSTPAMVTLQFLSTLTSNGALKATLEATKVNPAKLTLHEFYAMLRNGQRLKSTQADFLGSPGIYQFNFQTTVFDFIEPNPTLIKLIFPANELAYTNQLLNAELVANNLQFSPDSMPTNADLTMKIDLAVVMTGTYITTFSGGVPTSASISLIMAPYQIQLDFSGSGVNYASTLSMKLNSQEIMGYTMAMKYASDMKSVEQISGSVRMPPIRFDGWVNAQAMIVAMSDSTKRLDVAYLNSQMGVVVVQTSDDAQLGTLAFKLYTDPETGIKSPQVAVVYSDGSWEWLADILSGSGTKSSFTRWSQPR